MGELEKKFLELLQAAILQKSSDIHLMTGQPPAIRGHEGLLPVTMPAYTAEEMQTLAKFMVGDPEIKAKINQVQDLDGSFDIKNLGRFRYNIFRTSNGLGAVLRVIALSVPTIESLGLPPVLRTIADASRGLVLVTGATGSGKSSTLAAMIDHVNTTQNLHVLTIEDPIEYLHPQKKCRLSQREIGRDTKNFAVALKSALRQDPDVILVGEMRDHETLDIAMKAAETGHLVFSTVHTSDAMKTIGRLVSLFPPSEQASARIRLADNLHAIVSQRLVPGLNAPKVVAQEILINNLGISDCIANEKKTHEIPTFVEKGREVSGMQTFDQHLADLVNNDQISVDVALDYASNRSDFQRNLSFGALSGNKKTGGYQPESLDVEPRPVEEKTNSGVEEAPVFLSSTAPMAPTFIAPCVAPAKLPPSAPPGAPSGAPPAPPTVKPKIPKLPGAA